LEIVQTVEHKVDTGALLSGVTASPPPPPLAKSCGDPLAALFQRDSVPLYRSNQSVPSPRNVA
jgi:hypothetical protein